MSESELFTHSIDRANVTAYLITLNFSVVVAFFGVAQLVGGNLELNLFCLTNVVNTES